MKLNLEVRYFNTNYAWLCFKHATQLAMQGEDVDTEVDDFRGDNYLGSTFCPLCCLPETKPAEVHPEKDYYTSLKEPSTKEDVFTYAIKYGNDQVITGETTIVAPSMKVAKQRFKQFYPAYYLWRIRKETNNE